MLNFVLSDMVCKLRVAANGHLKSINVKNTLLCSNVLNILYKNGIIRNFFFIDNNKICVFLKYYQNRSVFYSIEIVSKPGKRIFWSLKFLASNYSSNNFSGFYIMSTNKGIVASNDCLLGSLVGGEVLLKILV